MTVAIITDSAAALPDSLLESQPISVVPILMTVDGREVAEGELSNAELLAGEVKTSAPTPGAFTRAIGAAAGQDGALVVTVASNLSATFQAAEVGAAAASCPTQVLDTGTAAGAQALVAAAAARAALDGANLEEAAAVASIVSGRVRLVGALSGLSQLVKTGRIPALAGRAGDKIGVKPMFEIRGGEIRRLLPARSPAAAHERILSQFTASPGSGDLQVAAIHADAPEDAATLLAAVRTIVTPAMEFTGGFGQALISAAGTGVSGLAWWWSED